MGGVAQWSELQMAALPYIQLYVADYLADTMHLTTEEHGAYLLLIFNYWQTGKPIPKKRLASVARMLNERWTDVEETLSEFFNDTGTHWQHDRIDADLLAVNEKQIKASRAGKASAAARAAKKKQTAIPPEKPGGANGRLTDVEQTLQQKGNHKDTDKDKETDTDTDTENKKNKQKKSGLDYSGWPEQPSAQVLADWLAMRKRLKADVSQTVINRFRKELELAHQAGVSVDDCLAECVTRNWRGFEFQWLLNAGYQGQTQTPKNQARAKRDAEVDDWVNGTTTSMFGQPERVIEGELIDV